MSSPAEFEVPEGWSVQPLKYLVDPHRPITYGIVQCGPHVEGGIPYIRPVDMSDESGVDPATLQRTAPEIAAPYGRSVVKGGDLVVSIGPSFGKAMVVPEVLSGANLTQGTARVAANRVSHPRFLFWVLRSDESRAQWSSGSSGATFSALTLERLANTKCPVPPLPQQRAIADFLDHETAKIDALIAKQQELIERIDEKRVASITTLVLRGQNPEALLKNSGVDWIGCIPEHWTIRSIGSVSTKITNGYVGPTRDIFVDSGVTYLQSLHIKNNRILFNQPYYVSEEWSRRRSKSILGTGDVLIVQTGDIGQVAVVTPDFEGANCHALIVVSTMPDIVSGEYLSWVLNSDYGFNALKSIQTGALHPHLNCGNVKFVQVPVPPLDEQHQIVAEVVEQLAKYDGLAAASARQIELSKEHRSALITAAVTGQIEVATKIAAEAAA